MMPTGRDDESPGAAAPPAGLAADDRAAQLERQSSVRHELRAPLAVMEPLLEMLLEEGSAVSEGHHQSLAMLQRNLQRLGGYLDSVVNSGWLECAAVSAQPELVRLAPLMDEIVAERGLLASGSLAGLHVAVPTDLPLLRWDRERLRQVIVALLDNAEVAAAAAGRVTVTATREPDDAVHVIVTDDGPGLTKDDLARAFDFGVVGDVGRTRARPGLGVGLWVCRRFVTDAGGRVWLESEPGAGCRAHAVLPAAAD